MKNAKSKTARLRIKDLGADTYENVGQRTFSGTLPEKGQLIELRRGGALRLYEVIAALRTDLTRPRAATLFLIERSQGECDQALLDAEQRSGPITVWIRIVQPDGGWTWLETHPIEFRCLPRIAERFTWWPRQQKSPRYFEIIGLEHHERSAVIAATAVVIERTESLLKSCRWTESADLVLAWMEEK